MLPEAAPPARWCMADVAARAGVSHQTVSRVVNGHPSVAPQTRERVQRAIAELGYRPNLAARALVTGSTRTIGLVTVKINQYGPGADACSGWSSAARAAGYSLSVSILDDATAEAMREAVDRFVAQSVDAVVALGTYDDAAEALHSVDAPVPLVAVQVGGAEDRAGRRRGPGDRRPAGHPAPAGPRAPHRAPRRRAGRLAGGPRPHGRLAGRARRGRRAGAGDRCAGDWTPSSGHAAGRDAGRPASGPARTITAVFLANDQMALGLLAALHEEGLRCPDDVSVVGFDDLPGGAVLHAAADHRAAGLRRARPPRRPAGAGPAGRRGPAAPTRCRRRSRAGEHRTAPACRPGLTAAMLALTSQLAGHRAHDGRIDQQPFPDGREGVS